ncbi:uncharacterized protein LAESUDRAFT_276206 [Laetiporus sulphureus 93-53]|uniref:Uncharacterized protein n=1 Tax=Laetiporus sulphureus 93-53 TaxID=1314785 RepID=A0A165HCZ9_9APHY|nr:uncharacterized protein LAESUDRAFT_276206 [Laetiporus sulphureus 93-53]KZT11568.1 hypothetical protein LAESUDRAFT_276206 [Laetiporus sulphureus 93-53]
MVRYNTTRERIFSLSTVEDDLERYLSRGPRRGPRPDVSAWRDSPPSRIQSAHTTGISTRRKLEEHIHGASSFSMSDLFECLRSSACFLFFFFSWRPSPALFVIVVSGSLALYIPLWPYGSCDPPPPPRVCSPPAIMAFYILNASSSLSSSSCLSFLFVKGV